MTPVFVIGGAVREGRQVHSGVGMLVTRVGKQAHGSVGVAVSDAKQHGAAAPILPSTAILFDRAGCELFVSTVRAVCAKQSNQQNVHPTSEIQPIPKYVDEIRVAEMTGMSRAWFQRARSEGMGPAG